MHAIRGNAKIEWYDIKNKNNNKNKDNNKNTTTTTIQEYNNNNNNDRLCLEYWQKSMNLHKLIDRFNSRVCQPALSSIPVTACPYIYYIHSFSKYLLVKSSCWYSGQFVIIIIPHHSEVPWTPVVKHTSLLSTHYLLSAYSLLALLYKRMCLLAKISKTYTCTWAWRIAASKAVKSLAHESKLQLGEEHSTDI